MTTIMLSPPMKTPIPASRFQQPRRPPLIERRAQNAERRLRETSFFRVLRSAICVLASLTRKHLNKKANTSHPIKGARGTKNSRGATRLPAMLAGARYSEVTVEDRRNLLQ